MERRRPSAPKTPPAREVADRTGPLLAAILLLALGLRLAAFFSLRATVYFDFLLWDERVYHQWAAALAAGTWESSEVYRFAPLPAWAFALVYRVFGPDPAFVRMLNLALGTLTVLPVFAVGRELGGRSAGLLAALLAAVYAPFTLYSVVPLKTALALFLFALTLWLTLAALREPRLPRMAAAGVALGVMVHVRGNCLALIPLAGLVLAADALRRRLSLSRAVLLLAVYTAGLAAGLAPVVIRNHRVAGEWALTTSQTGRNLYYGNTLRHPDPYYRPLPFASTEPAEQAVQFVIEASRRAGRRLTPQETSAFWTRQVLREAAAAPAAFAAKTGRKLLALFNRYEPADHYHMGFLSRHAVFFRLPLAGIGLILPLGLAGFFLLLPASRPARILLLAGLLYGATLVAFFTSARYRLPLVLLLIPAAAAGLARLPALAREKRRRELTGWGLAVAVAAAVAWLPVRGTGDLTAYWNTHAVILDSRKRTAEAVANWRESVRLDGAFSDYARLFLAGKRAMAGDFAEAGDLLAAIDDDAFAAAARYALTGDIAAHRGDLRGAAAAYERSLAINSGQRRIRRELIRIYRRIDPGRIPGAMADLRRVESFYRPAAGGTPSRSD